MTNDQIIELAKQAGFQVDEFDDGIWLAYTSEIQRFAELVRNEVLEEAATACDVWGSPSSVTYIGSGCKVAAQRLRSMKK